MKNKSDKHQEVKLKLGFKTQLLMGWIISLFIPFFVLFIIVFVQYGDGFVKVLSGDIDLWQKNGYTLVEQFSRDINIWANGSPEFQNHHNLESDLSEKFDESHSREGFILERKGDEVVPFVPIRDDLLKDVEERFKNLDKTLLPEFGEREITSNEKLLTETGYILLKHYDFYYSDGEEGSIFLFIKYTDVPAIILKVLGDNLLFLILGLLLIHAFLSYGFVKRMTKPITSFLNAMRAYQKQDFSVRLNEKMKQPMLKTINSSVNKMASELQDNQSRVLIIEKQRMEFIAKISHDIKTPLASINAHAEAFRDGLVEDNEKRMRYTANILKKVQSMDVMINELSLYSDLETGLDQYSFTNVNLNHYLIDILEELAYDYPDVDLKIDYEKINDIVLVDLDVDRFNRVLMNIVKNSVRYSEKDSINIDVKVFINTSNQTVSIKIRDDGEGIDSDNLDYLFESFTRGDVSRNPNKTGSGLGLTIAKTIVERHDGDIKLYSEWHKYFEVVIKLPIGGMNGHEEGIDN